MSEITFEDLEITFADLPDGTYHAMLQGDVGPYLCEKRGKDWYFIDGIGYDEHFDEAELVSAYMIVQPVIVQPDV